MAIFAAKDATHVTLGVLLYVVAGILMVLAALVAGRFVRRALPGRVKGEPYECGEPAIGESWVQFDLRFYVVALVFLIFDVEIVLLFPWAAAFKTLGAAGVWSALVFLAILAVPFIYLWRFGYLDWVKSVSAGEAIGGPTRPGMES